MLHLQQLPSRVSNKTQTGKEGANERQPYFLLMAVLGAGRESISLGYAFWTYISWGGPLCFVKNGESGTKYQVG